VAIERGRQLRRPYFSASLARQAVASEQWPWHEYRISFLFLKANPGQADPALSLRGFVLGSAFMHG
jgi:hypothetical protein